MSILSELQDKHRPNVPRLDVSSMRCAGMIHSSQSRQDPYALCP